MANKVLKIKIDDDMNNDSLQVSDINNIKGKKQAITYEDLDKFNSKEKSFYNNISVEEYLKESRHDR